MESIRSVPGVGSKMAERFAILGIRTLEDMISFMPRSYDDRTQERMIADTTEENPTAICRIYVKKTSSFYNKKHEKTLKATVVDDDGTEMDLLCFNRSFLENSLYPGSSWYIIAQIMIKDDPTFFGRKRYRSSASFELKKTKAEAGIGTILPIYPLTEGLTEKIMRQAAEYALRTLDIMDSLPFSIYERYHLLHEKEAYNLLHFPKSLKDAERARKSLAFSELFSLLFPLLRGKPERKSGSVPMTESEKALISSLPFSLTEDQLKAAEEIREDLSSGTPMNRLLQGDVGSGKTLVAWISALHAIEKGGQVAFMAPTELLAKQHADGASDLLSKLGIRIAFLSGNVKGQPRRLLLQSLKNGDIDLIIGTHALFSEDVEFRNLTLAIIDEQHRFGIRQREALAEKGHKPSVLYMTATPIPRSLALTMLADYDISTLKTMPSGRIPIKTHTVFQESTRKAMYETIGVEFQRGHQAYFVYPRIDDEGEGNLLDVTTMYSKLKEIYPEVPSALIHSKLPEEEKMQILNDFRNKKIMYLVATSVVEVGIDVPDATCMVIEHAERFGLAALHQLRGRVGRSSLPSYCFLVAIGNLTEDARQRLKIMKETNDGFLIADKDLEIRGPGDIGDGERQSGFIALKFSSIATDLRLVEAVRAECERILKEDRGLLKAENAPLRNISQKR